MLFRSYQTNSDRASSPTLPNYARWPCVDGTVKVWDVISGEEVLTNQSDGRWAVSISPDGKLIASDGTKILKVWETDNGNQKLTLTGHSTINSVAFSRNGRWIVSGGVSGEVIVWDATSGEATFTLKGHTDSVLSLVFSADGKRMASASKMAVKIWDAEKWVELLTINEHSDAATVRTVSFSPDGRRIVSGSDVHTVKVWDTESGEELVTYKGHTLMVSSVSFSRDGRRIISGGWDGAIHIWEADSRRALLTLKGHTRDVHNLQFSQDGHRIISGSRDTTVRVWDARPESESHDRTIEREARTAFAFHHAIAIGRDELITALGNAPALNDSARLMALGWATTLPLNFPRLDEQHKLAHTYQKNGQNDLALPLFEESFRVRLRSFGANDATTLNYQNCLASAYRDVKKHDLSIALYADVLARLQTSRGESHADTLAAREQLAVAYELARKFEQALSLYDALLKTTTATLPRDDAEYSFRLGFSGNCLLSLERFAEAEPMLRECLTISEKVKPDHWWTANAQRLLGIALAGQKKFDDAEKLINDGLTGLVAQAAQLPKDGPIGFRETGDLLVKIYTDANKPDQAKQWRTKLDEARAAFAAEDEKRRNAKPSSK